MSAPSSRVELEAPQGEPRVEPVGELRPQAADRLARRRRGEAVALDDDDVGDPGPGEVERDGGPDDPAADHDDLRVGRERVGGPGPHRPPAGAPQAASVGGDTYRCGACLRVSPRSNSLRAPCSPAPPR